MVSKSSSVPTRSTELKSLFVKNETPIVFFVKRDVPERLILAEKIEKHGGEITDFCKEADYVLGDPLKTQISLQGVEKITSYKFVLDSINEKRLRNPSDYDLIITGKRIGRSYFSPQDDINLENYLRGITEDFKGNEIYKRFEKTNPRHPWQAWRYRAINKILNKLNVSRNAQTISKIQSENSSSTLRDVDPDDLATEEILKSYTGKSRNETPINHLNLENSSRLSQDLDDQILEITENDNDANRSFESEVTFTDTNKAGGEINQINYLTDGNSPRSIQEDPDNRSLEAVEDDNDVTESFDTITFTDGKAGSEINQINYLSNENSLRSTQDFDDQNLEVDTELQSTSLQTSKSLGKRRRFDEDIQEQPTAKRQRYSAVDEEFLFKVKELSEEFHVPKTEVIRILGDTSCNFTVVRNYLSNNVTNEKYFWDSEEDLALLASIDDTRFGDILQKHGAEQLRERMLFLTSFFNR